ncbi:survival motor neuron protein [Anopheles cruzii]|uniref:survival motor neuron protein n=1 Tax=Anopheles cruzii TaxID=68878 RepID=UPI0022EC3863|nr:survival motor neuron protein [Anopheles cruzii]
MSTSGKTKHMANTVESTEEPTTVAMVASSSRDDIWDDSIIIKKYDASLALIKEEVAKRLAMKTNRKNLPDAPGCSRKTAKKDSESVTDGMGSPSQEEKGTMEVSEQELVNGGRSESFEIGDYVRATYDDGVDYEAKIIGFGSHGDCLIRYVGYNNEQTVLIEELVPSWGRKARRQQRAEAAEAEATAADSQMDVSDDERFTKQASKIKINFGSHFGRPGMGHVGSMGNGRVGMGGGLGGSTAYMVPPPPPMPPMLEDADDVESENLSAMLMSWYMSGYYTGLYHGQRMSQQQQQQQTQQQKRARQS